MLGQRGDVSKETGPVRPARGRNECPVVIGHGGTRRTNIQGACSSIPALPNGSEFNRFRRDTTRLGGDCVWKEGRFKGRGCRAPKPGGRPHPPGPNHGRQGGRNTCCPCLMAM